MKKYIDLTISHNGYIDDISEKYKSTFPVEVGEDENYTIMDFLKEYGDIPLKDLGEEVAKRHRKESDEKETVRETP